MKKLTYRVIITMLAILMCINTIFPYVIYAYNSEPSQSEKNTMKQYIEDYMRKQIQEYINTYNNISTTSPISKVEELPEYYKNDLKELIEEKEINVDLIINSYDTGLYNKYTAYLSEAGSELFETADYYLKNSMTPAKPINVSNNNDDSEITLGGTLDGLLGLLLYPIKLFFVVPVAIFKIAMNTVAGGDATLQNIFFNKIDLVNINIFDSKNDAIRQTVATYYVAFRNLAIAISFAMLLYIGIRMAGDNIGENRAKYKSMLFNWLVRVSAYIRFALYHNICN